MHSLIESLFALLLATPQHGPLPLTQRRIGHSSESDWRRALDALGPHKVFPLLSHQLTAFGLMEQVPAAARARLHEVHEEVRGRNRLLLLTLARILRMVAARGESVLLLKGILFADSFYPDFSTRPMSDIDLVAVRGRDEVLFALLEEAGFRPSLHHSVQDHSITYMNREGVFCDAHRTLPMFVSEPWHRIRADFELTHVRGVKVLALEPHALVAHLVTHMHSHAPELGFVMLWVLDLALVLRRYAGQLDLRRVRKLMGSEGAWALLLRLVRMLANAGEPVEPKLLAAARALPPLSVAGVLRQRRITPWGLPRPMGWLRLLAHQLGVHRSDRPVPCLPDLVLWPLDELGDRIAPPLSRLSLR